MSLPVPWECFDEQTCLHLQTSILAGSACPSNGPSMDHCQQGAMASLMCEEHEVRISEKDKHTNEEEYREEGNGFLEDSVFFFGKISIVLKDFTPAGYPSFHFAR